MSRQKTALPQTTWTITVKLTVVSIPPSYQLHCATILCSFSLVHKQLSCPVSKQYNTAGRTESACVTSLILLLTLYVKNQVMFHFIAMK